MHHFCASQTKLSSEINFIKKLASWKDFHRSIIIVLFIKCLTKQMEALSMLNSLRCLSFMFICNKGLPLIKACLCKFRSNCFKTCSIRFKTQYDVNKTEFYWNTKDKTAVLCKLIVVCDFCCCPGCGAN